jgi:hypothetical protein
MIDTWVPVVRAPGAHGGGGPEQVFIPAGGEVFLDAVALHYNRARAPALCRCDLNVLCSSALGA